MSSLKEVLAAANGTAQPWNEVYQHPSRIPRKSLKRRFALAQKLERRALSSGVVQFGCPSECGLDRAELDSYTKACGLDVDVGVGSLILALNSMPGVVTLSSCSSVHEGAHEQEALVALTADDETAMRIAKCVGSSHFRESRDDVVKLKGRGKTPFRSYIVFSAAMDAAQRVKDLTNCAELLHALVVDHADAEAQPKRSEAIRKKRKIVQPGIEEMPLQWDSIRGKASALRKSYKASEGPWAVVEPLCDQELLTAMRGDLVGGLRGLRGIDTKESSALVCPLSPTCDALQSLPRLAGLLAALYSQPFRDFLQEVTDCGPLAAQPNASLIALPEGGFWLPQCLAGTGSVRGVLAFTLFLVEDWWQCTDGGQLEVYGLEASLPGFVMTPRFNALLIHAPELCTASLRVATDRAPRLALHGTFQSGVAAAVHRPLPVPEVTKPGLECSGEFVDADREALRPWIAARYLRAKRMLRMQNRFAQDSHIKLPRFLRSQKASAAANAVLARDEIDAVASASSASHTKGSDGGWMLAGPVARRRYLKFGEKVADLKSCTAGLELERLANLFSSAPFLRYMQAITGLRPSGAAHHVEARRFRPGRDYIIQSQAASVQLDVILCVGLGGIKRWCELGAADGYAEANPDHEESRVGLLGGPDHILPQAPLLRLPPRANMLRVVLRDTRTARFVEPISAAAPNSRWDVSLALPVEPLSESSDDGEEEEEEVEEDDDED